MAHTAHDLRINVVELLRHPGATRHIEATVPPAEIDLDDDRVAGDIAIAIDAISSVDGVVVHGTVSTPWRGQCRRCLTDVAGTSVSVVEELFQQHPEHEDAIEITGDRIDLAPVVREYVLLDLPDLPLCKDDCAGICPNCGIDRNVATCDCDTSVTDPRWSALEGLNLDDE
jgi:DUF177 domain-containing protein